MQPIRIDKIGKDEAESIFAEKLWPLIRSHADLFPVKDQDEAAFLKIFHRMGSLIMAYAFHDTLPGQDEDEDMNDDEDDEDEEEEKVTVSMVPMADMLNHKTGYNNVRELPEICHYFSLSGLSHHIISNLQGVPIFSRQGCFTRRTV